MTEFAKVAEKKDIPEGESIAVQVGQERIAVFNIGGTYYAIRDLCPHAGGPLSQGCVSGTRITCPWHGWQFELCPNNGKPNDGICRYAVQVEGEDIKIAIE